MRVLITILILSVLGFSSNSKTETAMDLVNLRMQFFCKDIKGKTNAETIAKMEVCNKAIMEALSQSEIELQRLLENLSK